MNRTLLYPRFHIKSTKKRYEPIEEIQTDLNILVQLSNFNRCHTGYRLDGRIPAQALRHALSRKKLPPIIPKEDENAIAEAGFSESPEIPSVG